MSHKVLRVLHKPRVQTILRYLVDFASRSPVHGLGYLAKKNIHWCEFTYWVLALSFMLIYGFKCGLELIITYRSRNSAITYKIDYMQLNTLYPSVTICPHQILDPEKVQSFIGGQYYLQNNEEREQFREFLQKLSKVSGRKAYHFNLGIDINIPAEDYMETIFNLSQVYDVRSHGKPAVKVMTDVGICYTVNNILHKEMYTKNWFDSRPYPPNVNDGFTPHSPTFNFSHYYPIEIEISHNITGKMTIYIHSPYEIPTTWSRGIVSDAGQTIKLIAGIRQITYQPNLLTETNIDERRCRTSTQSNLTLFPSTYSQNLCLMQCRADLIARICHCTPHFYRNRNVVPGVMHDPVCNAQGLNCHAQHIQLFRNINTKSTVFKCQCYPNCISQIVITKFFNIPPQTNKSKVFFNIEYPPLESYERSVMYSYLDYAVTLFNVMSAFLGFSILGLCDFIYFFTIRIYWFRRGYRGSVNNN